jgi:phosphoribosylglycinamide formyltransferase-1
LRAVPLKIAILVSGRGSNMESILRAIKEGHLDAKVEAVISNNPEALALPLARKYGVHAIAIDNKGLKRQEHEKMILEELEQYDLDLLVLAGYMRLLTPTFLHAFRAFKNRDENAYFPVVNIHPSLLPAFKGANAYEDAFAYGVHLSGVTIHLVDEEMDHGPILAQEAFPRLPEDTFADFKARGLAVEHKLYPQVLQKIAQAGSLANLKIMSAKETVIL